ncbi:hypothetical protein SAY86_004812 [Trapa natans]|uniref:Transferring glycosyl group transferase n=1 Tax=Trapa natans TaxID=22666 RepID=A0AAN7RJ89_TRANT|nr:hypothetical protein SAY86_004812 [Trapa natans]
MEIPISIPSSTTIALSLRRFMGYLLAFIFIIYLFYSLKLIFFPPPWVRPPDKSFQLSPLTELRREEQRTGLRHIVFGVAASANLWDRRKEYIKLWWKPGHTKGIVWLDRPVKNNTDRHLLPELMISSNTSNFKYSHSNGHRSAIRISRIVSETMRFLNNDSTLDDGVRWLVMGDDDTVFVPDNLVRVLSKYDHKEMYYVGSSSESHTQNMYFSYNMAYGGGGFAISRPLAVALEKMQDGCIQRYPYLYGSDDRIHACMAELGVPLTREQGFHQFDVHGNAFGLLAAHPVTPLVSLHHIDLVEPIFPNVDRVQALRRLMMGPSRLDSAGLLQMSICYDMKRSWTVLVSWGYAVQIYRGIRLPRDLEMPSKTFLSWHWNSDSSAFSFNTRPDILNKNTNKPCDKPSVYFLSNALYNPVTNNTASEYLRHWSANPNCEWKIGDPSRIKRVEVYKKPNPRIWDKAPRRNCCKVLPTAKKQTVVIDVGACYEDGCML